MPLKMFWLTLLAVCVVVGAMAQQAVPDLTGMLPGRPNYTSFTTARQHLSPEAVAANKQSGDHPELGMLYAEAPCTACYELIGERTASTKTFVREGSGGSEIMMQTSSAPMHLRDTAGRWRTISARLTAQGEGVFGAMDQEEPVIINCRSGESSLGKGNELFRFNNGLELVYVDETGKEETLGAANWKEYTAGDDGVYVRGAWPGIDIELRVVRGAIKTSFVVQRALPAYSKGQLRVRDHPIFPAGLHWAKPRQKTFTGNLEVVDERGNPVYRVGGATVYQQDAAVNSLQAVPYELDSDMLDVVVPGEWFNRPAAAYPVVIDPLVSLAAISTVGGSTYSPAKTVSCDYLNPATVPAGVQVTDVRWSFNYIASGGAHLLNGGLVYTLGTCRSPTGSGLFWFCNLPSAGTCTGTNVSIYSDISSCIPGPSCTAYPLNLNMHFYQNYASTLPCATTYITAGSPLTVTVFGRSVEARPIGSAGGLLAICLGQSVTLSDTAMYGVPPYTYTWTPGTVTGSPVTLTPPSSTPYTVTATDACGDTATATQTIVVTPLTGIGGTATLCVGNTTLLTHTGSGSWLSTNTAVATIGSASGTVTGITAGTSTISFVTATGCYATRVVTVIPLPDPVTGTTELCETATTALADPTPGGTWSSGAMGVAWVSSAGMVTAVSPGTATISYTTSPGCDATVVVTVHPNPVLTSLGHTDPGACGAADGTITIHGLLAGESYMVSYLHGSATTTLTLTATSAGELVISGLAAGSYTSFVVTSSHGCTSSLESPEILTDPGAPPAPVAGNTSPVCVGAIVTLTATGPVGVSYQWSGPGGFSSTMQNPVIDPASLAAAGEYTVTASLLACVSPPAYTTVSVTEAPHIGDMEYWGTQQCNGNEGYIVLRGLTPGATYNVGYQRNGTPVYITLTANGDGEIRISGLTAGEYTGIFVARGTCVSNLVGPVKINDPEPPPAPILTTNAPVCEGDTLQLSTAEEVLGGNFTWAGPAGFSAAGPYPFIFPVTAGATGVYTVMYSLYNCVTTATIAVTLYPVVRLRDVYADQYVLPYGDSVQLHADGALYYIWTPLNKTLSNAYIPDPFAKPRDSVTLYRVRGYNEWACSDSADLIIRVVFDEDEFIPNAFSPNGDGLNDVFRISDMQYKKLVDFAIYNRWGEVVYRNQGDPYGGWDGKYKGIAQEIGTYYYTITIERANGKKKYYKGNLTLIR